jgi:hypothetical protein
MSFTTDLLVGIAQMIADSSIADYNATGIYTATQTGIVFKVLPPSPDRAVILTAVPMTDMATIPLGLMMVQVRTRGLPNQPLDVDDLGDAIFDLLHGVTDKSFGSCHAVQILRKSSIPMGQDPAKRWERVDHFYIDLDMPPSVARPTGGSW